MSPAGQTKTMAEADMKRLNELLAMPMGRSAPKKATRFAGAHSRNATDPLLGTSNHFYPQVSPRHRRTLSAPAVIPHNYAIETVRRIEKFELGLTEQVREQARIESQRRLRAMMMKKRTVPTAGNARGAQQQLIGPEQRTAKAHHSSSLHNRSPSSPSMSVIGVIEELEADLPTQVRAVRSRTTSSNQHYQQLRATIKSK